MKRILTSIVVIGILILRLVHFFPTSAQSTRNLNCGDIVEAELTPNEPRHDYLLSAPAGTILNGTVEPIGNTFNPYIHFLDSGGKSVSWFNGNGEGGIEEFSNFIISSTNSTLVIVGANTGSGGVGKWASIGEYYGAYTIYFGCVLRDGRVINPGDIASSLTNNDQQSQPLTSTFSGIGFPGLAPVDFARSITISFNLDDSNSGEITPDFDAVFGYKFSANAGEIYTFDFSKLSGNLNLGLAIISPDNQVIFYGSLVSSNHMQADVIFPDDGEYTIGVFQVGLFMPSVPKVTVFEITARKVGS